VGPRSGPFLKTVKPTHNKTNSFRPQTLTFKFPFHSRSFLIRYFFFPNRALLNSLSLSKLTVSADSHKSQQRTHNTDPKWKWRSTKLPISLQSPSSLLLTFIQGYFTFPITLHFLSILPSKDEFLSFLNFIFPIPYGSRYRKWKWNRVRIYLIF
jgi:hypothetical protein